MSVPVLAASPQLRSTTSRPRDSVRPVPLQFVTPTLLDLAAPEHWFGRGIGWMLAIVSLSAGMLVAGVLNENANRSLATASPTVNSIGVRLIELARHRTIPWHPVAIRIPLDVLLSIPPVNIGSMASLGVIGFVLFLLAVRLAGTFGGLLTVLLWVTGDCLNRDVALPEAIALLGVLSLIGGWQDRGLKRSIVGSTWIALAASMSHPQALLLPLVLVIALDLPWRWSWCMPVAWAATVGTLLWCDAHFFGIHLNVSQLSNLARLNWHQSVSTALRMLQDWTQPTWFLLPLGIAGLGLLAKADWRWGLLIGTLSLPGLAVILLSGAVSGHAVTLILPPLILAAIWLTCRSALAAGLITAIVCGMSLRLSLGH